MGDERSIYYKVYGKCASEAVISHHIKKYDFWEKHLEMIFRTLLVEEGPMSKIFLLLLFLKWLNVKIFYRTSSLMEPMQISLTVEGSCTEQKETEPEKAEDIIDKICDTTRPLPSQQKSHILNQTYDILPKSAGMNLVISFFKIFKIYANFFQSFALNFSSFTQNLPSLVNVFIILPKVTFRWYTRCSGRSWHDSKFWWYLPK